MVKCSVLCFKCANNGNFLVLSDKLMEIHSLARGGGENKSSYVHGCSTVSLLFDTVGERLRMAAKNVNPISNTSAN